MSRLTEEMVIARSKQSDLGTIKKLNCWGSELSDVSIIRRMHGVELLALSVNRISTLSDFENCVKLQELYLRKNNIQDINDLQYLQGLQHLRHLWLEENPCVDKAGPNYRQMVLRALPNLQKLDNIDVTSEELAEAMRNVSLVEEDNFEDPYPPQQYHSQPPQQQQRQQSPPSPPAPQQHNYASSQYQPQHQQEYQQPQQSQPNRQSSPQQHHHQQPTQQHQPPPPQQQQQQWRSNSPVRDPPPVQQPVQPQPQHSPDITEDSISEVNERGSIPTSPLQRNSPNLDYSPAEPKFNRDQHRNSYNQSFDRSPGSDHDIPIMAMRERRAMPPSMSMHSMKEYYHSDRPTPPFYRHSQTDLTEWDESPQNDHTRHNGHSHASHNNNNHNQHNGNGSATQSQRRNGPPEREGPHGTNGYSQSYGRNGSSTPQQNGKDKQEEWEDNDRMRRDTRSRRPDSRFNDSASVVSNSVLNHYASLHRRPVNRSANLLSATLCLVKELDYPSLEVVEHAVRCRIEELSAD